VPRDSFLFRTDPRVLAALRRWAEDELRSVNGQMDYLLRRALRESGRWKEELAQDQDDASDRLHE
jgi:hypothetical protein